MSSQHNHLEVVVVAVFVNVVVVAVIVIAGLVVCQLASIYALALQHIQNEQQKRFSVEYYSRILWGM